MHIGFFSNGHRHNNVARVSYEEDIDEIVLADELGMTEGWISEHGTFVSQPMPDNLPCADLMICKAAALTKKIKLGPGIRPLPFFHPLQVATDSAVVDHLTGGRYMAGFGIGLGGAGEPRGKLPGTPRDMAAESIDLILKAWSHPEPFDFTGKFWQVKNARIIPMPYTKPRMDVGIACSRTDSTARIAARHGFFPLLTWTTPAQGLRPLIDHYLETTDGEHQPTRKNLRVARFCYVSDSIESARRELRDAELGSARSRFGGYLPEGMTAKDITVDWLIDVGAFIVGNPDDVLAQLKTFNDDCGGFGTLLLVCGKDWATPKLRENSMRAFMKHVAPRLPTLAS